MLKWKLRKSKNSPCILSNQIINKLQNTYFNIPGKGVRKFLSTSMPCEPSQEQRMDSANIQPLQFHKGTQQLDVFSEEDTITQGCNIQYTPFFGLTEIPLRCSTLLSVNCDFQLAVTEYLLYGTPWRKYARSLSDPIMIPGHTWNHPR